MPTYDATHWPILLPGPITVVPGVFALAPAPVEGPVAIPPPVASTLTSGPTPPAPNPTRYKSAVTTAAEIRAFFTQTSPSDAKLNSATPPPPVTTIDGTAPDFDPNNPPSPPRLIDLAPV